MRWVAFALIVAIAPQRVHASGSGVVVLADDAHRISEAFAAAMRLSGVARVSADARSEARSAIAAGAEPVESLARLRFIREAIDEGWRAYHGVQFDAAATRFAAARKAAESLLPLPGAPVLYADASLRLGIVLARLGRTVEAREALALALALDPDRPISPIEFAPEVIALIDGVRAQALPKRTVRVTTDPSGATLTVDGRDVGRSPATIELTVGEHVAIARSPGQSGRSIGFAVSDATDAVRLPVAPSDERGRLLIDPSFGMSSSDAQSLIDDVVLFADLDDVVLAAEIVRGGEPVLFAQRCSNVPAKCTRTTETAYGDRTRLLSAVQAVWRDLHEQEVLHPPSLFGDPRLVPTRGGSERCALCRNPYVLAGLGAAVVAGVIAVAVVATGSRPPPVLTVDPSMFSR